MLRQQAETLTVTPPGPGLHDITTPVARFVAGAGIFTGLLTLFCRHTSASLLIQENADPDVARDLEAYFRRLAPEGGPYVHTAEGPDDMPAHLRAALTQVALAIPVAHGRLRLGTWQGIFLFEHRRIPGKRELALHLLGE